MAAPISVTITITFERRTGAFRSREAIAEAFMDEAPHEIEVEESEYEVTEWTTS